MNSLVNVGWKNETHAQAIKTVVSVNANLHIKSQRLRVLLGNKAIRHFRASMAVSHLRGGSLSYKMPIGKTCGTFS